MTRIDDVDRNRTVEIGIFVFLGSCGASVLSFASGV